MVRESLRLLARVGAVGAAAITLLVSTGCQCFDTMGASYHCVCSRPLPDGGTGQSAFDDCVVSAREAQDGAESGCGSGCSCTCTRRDDSDACVYEHGAQCR